MAALAFTVSHFLSEHSVNYCRDFKATLVSRIGDDRQGCPFIDEIKRYVKQLIQFFVRQQ
jgi:hypothetical protein